MTKQLAVSVVYLAAGLMLGSCQHTKPTDDPAPTSALLATRWMLVQVDATPVALSSYSEDYKSYIQFAAVGQQTTGLAACDAIQGQYTLASSTNQLAISQLTTAKGSCSSPSVGARYLAALPQTSYYALSNDTLRLYNSQHMPILVFKAGL